MVLEQRKLGLEIVKRRREKMNGCDEKGWTGNISLYNETKEERESVCNDGDGRGAWEHTH